MPSAGRHHGKQCTTLPAWSMRYLSGWLSQPTAMFGLRLWALMGTAVGAAVVLVLLLIFVFLSRGKQRDDLTSNLRRALASSCSSSTCSSGPHTPTKRTLPAAR
ncbi:hypothetical protein ACP70R_000999 [Stipagrostis hirtigluma subsp. patula]